MSKPALTALLAAAAVLAPGLALAHYGWSAYDESRAIEVSGPLRDIEWANPYTQARVTYRGESWVVVLAPPTRLSFRGVSRERLIKASTLTLIAHPRADGAAEMRVESLIVDGESVDLREP